MLKNRNIRIAMSVYQVAEILEVLRRSGVSDDVRKMLIDDFETGKFFIKELDFSIVKECILSSTKSNIHVYDYLVAYPLKYIVDVIYSADDHFKHKDFSFAKIINPLEPWILREGRKPFKG